MNITRRKGSVPANRTPSFYNDFSSMLDGFFSGEPFIKDLQFSEWNPKADIVEKDKEYVIQADIPGANEKDLNVEVVDGILTVTGERKYEHEDTKNGYTSIERSYGSFTRSFELPENAEVDKITAGYDKGVLTVKIPKSKAKETKKIGIKVG